MLFWLRMMLRREVQRLTKAGATSLVHSSSRQETTHISRDQVQAELLSQQPGWNTLRPRSLELLINRLNRSGFPSQLTLQQRLDRLVSGLGTDLIEAVGGLSKTSTLAVLAAFALYGVRASEWLDEDPGRVVFELCRRQEQSRSSGDGRRTRTDQRSSDRSDTPQQSDSRADAFAVLELVPEASPNKQAHRRLVKLHHPDMGGSADAFRPPPGLSVAGGAIATTVNGWQPNVLCERPLARDRVGEAVELLFENALGFSLECVWIDAYRM